MEKINIAELLKDCPKGMELDCTMYDDCEFLDIDTLSDTYLIRIKTPCGIKYLDKYGRYTINDKAKCVIFPKGKTTWEGFQRPFKDGDVVTSNGAQIFIFKENAVNDGSGFSGVCYFGYEIPETQFFNESRWRFSRFATEEEKQKLFDAIKKNGYKWNAEKKELEKLVEPKFKTGDIVYIVTDEGEYRICIFERIVGNDMHTIASVTSSGHFFCPCKEQFDTENFVMLRLSTEKEKQKLFDAIKANGYKWDAKTKTLEKLIEPKFKVGDRVKKNKDYISGIVTDIFDDSFKVTYDSGGCCYVQFHYQCDWELVPNKFDINTLKTFEKVLVRDCNTFMWNVSLFSHIRNKKFFCIGAWYNQCIPYEENKHLLGTTNECDEYYKTWEE